MGDKTRPNQAVILAAGMGVRLSEIVTEYPKGFVELGSEALLFRSIRLLQQAGINSIIIVKGHQGDILEERLQKGFDGLCFVENPIYHASGSMHSLFVAASEIDGDFLLLESDLIYEYRALQTILDAGEDTGILVSGATNAGDEVYVYGENNNITDISKTCHPGKHILGELVGISRLSLNFFRLMIDIYSRQEPFPSLHHYEEIIALAARQRRTPAILVEDLAWTEIDTPEHYERADNVILPKIQANDRRFMED